MTRFFVRFTVSAACAATLLACAATAHAKAWELKAVGIPSGGTEGTLRGVSCTSTTFCIAVGDFNKEVWGADGNMWNGTSWTEASVQANPGNKNGNLRSVSCWSTTGCRASRACGGEEGGGGVGKTLIERLKEGKFTQIASPNPALGTGSEDGKFSELLGIACPTASFCLSTGKYVNTSGGGEAGAVLAEEWNSEEWLRLKPIEKPAKRKNATLWSTSCIEEGVCMSAGAWGREVEGTLFSQAGSESYNKAENKWNSVEAEEPITAKFATFYGISCTSSTFCMAVGQWSESVSSPPYKALADIWNGSSWTAVLFSGGVGITKESTFRGVSCPATEECEAVGSYVTSEGVEKSLVYIWKSKEWKVQTTSDPTGAKATSFNAISCTASETCSAVGGFVNSSNKLMPFAEK